MTHQDILNFISIFTNKFTKVDVIDTFTNGCCYWFAYILLERFPNSALVYDATLCHFGCEINHKVYDITGDVTESYEWIPWDSVDEFDKEIISKDCINLI